MDDVKAWLQQPTDIAQGEALYKKYGKDIKLLRYFAIAPVNDFKRSKLQSELQNLVQPGRPQPLIRNFITPQTKPVEKQKHYWNKDGQRDVEEQRMYSQWRPMYSNMMHLMANLDEVARQGEANPDKEKEAAKMALEILDLDDKIEQLYSDRDYYFTHGEVRPKKDIVPISQDSKQWFHKLSNHQRYVRKYRKKLETQPTNAMYKEKLKENEWAVAEYQKLLNLV